MPYRRLAQHIDDIEHRLGRMRRDDCTRQQALALLEELLGEARECLRQATAEICRRQRTEEQLRQSESRYRGIVENTHDVIMLTRSDGIITYMSPSTREVLGYQPEELVGRQPWIIHPEDLERMRQVHCQALEGRPGSNVEYRVFTKDGRVKWVSHSWSFFSSQPHDLIVSVVRDITEQKAAQAKIAQYEAQLRALASELILAEERERRRIAGDLHDDLSQKLVVAKIRVTMLMRSANDRSLEAPLLDLRQMIDDLIETSRSLTFQICPRTLYDLGFLPAVEWLAQDMLQRYGLEVRLADDGAAKPMDERIRVVLFRCLRELLINVAKHAGVNAATVEIHREQDAVRLAVCDEGKGFDPARIGTSVGRASFGLFSIQERLRYVGGQVEICSAPSRGTTVTLRVPVLLNETKGRETPP